MENKFLHRIKNHIKSVVLFIITTLASLSVFSQNSYAFTTCGAVGTTGPNQSSVNTAYLSTNLNGSVTVIGNGVQQWTVPATSMYRIQAIGASGGSVNISLIAAGGLGANMSGDFYLTAGQVLLILVGQKGGTIGQDGGGGGGSFVTSSSSVALIVAGGGGGAFNFGTSSTNYSGVNAQITTSGTPSAGGGGIGGVNGNGGTMVPSWASGGAGGGMITNGTGSSPSYVSGLAFINGANGGTALGNNSDYGGYGGGGAGWCCGASGGGGGGYSGGGTSYVFNIGGGGGGGSFNSGSNQLNTVAAALGDGKVIITPFCITATNAGNNPICFGNSATLTTNAVNSPIWSNGGNVASVIVSPTVTTTYTIIGTNIANCTGSAVITITVDIPNINLTSTPPFTCPGQTAVLTIANPSNNIVYNWNSATLGTSISVNPTITTSYSVVGFNPFTGCTNTSSIILPVYVTTFVVSSPTAICSGETATLDATGLATAYFWTANGGVNSPSVIVSPAVTTIYTVTGSTGTCTTTKVFSVVVNPLPDVKAQATQSNICEFEVSTIVGLGAANYSWNTGATMPVVNFTLSSSTTFTVTGTDINGCSNTATVTQFVDACTGFDSQFLYKLSELSVYPNPTTGLFTVKSDLDINLTVINTLGKIVGVLQLTDENRKEITVGNLTNGIYFLVGQSGPFKVRKKIIVEK